MASFLLLLALQLAVVAHELGHALVSRWMRVEGSRLKIGAGPVIGSYRLARHLPVQVGLVPIGAAGDPETSTAVPGWKRALTLLAGPVFSVGFAAALLAGCLLWGSLWPLENTVGAVLPDSAAAAAQLRPGDVIVAMNGEPLGRWSALLERSRDLAESPLVLDIERRGERLRIDVPPRLEPDGAQRPLGVSQQHVYREASLLETAGMVAEQLTRWLEESAHTLGRWLRGQPGGRYARPHDVFEHARREAVAGVDGWLRLCAALSVGVGALQLLPLPMFDLGRLALELAERLRGRALAPKRELIAHAIGWLLLAGALARMLW